MGVNDKHAAAQCNKKEKKEKKIPKRKKEDAFMKPSVWPSTRLWLEPIVQSEEQQQLTLTAAASAE
jgi:hypothetical protein